MKNYSLPTRKECFELIRQYHVPLHILEHSLAVAGLAGFLAQKLNEKGINVDVDLVDRACLLHDIVRVCDFEDLDYDRFRQTITEEDKAKWLQIRTKYKDLPHEDAAYDILKEKYPVLASTIRKHKYTAMLDEKNRPDTWEEKLLYYADMRAMANRIVPLKTRLDDAHKRNIHLHGCRAQSKSIAARVDPLIYGLEKEIFDIIGSDPLSITNELVESHSNNARN